MLCILGQFVYRRTSLQSGLTLFKAGHLVSGGSSQHYHMETIALYYKRNYRQLF